MRHAVIDFLIPLGVALVFGGMIWLYALAIRQGRPLTRFMKGTLLYAPIFVLGRDAKKQRDRISIFSLKYRKIKDRVRFTAGCPSLRVLCARVGFHGILPLGFSSTLKMDSAFPITQAFREKHEKDDAPGPGRTATVGSYPESY